MGIKQEAIHGEAFNGYVKARELQTKQLPFFQFNTKKITHALLNQSNAKSHTN